MKRKVCNPCILSNSLTYCGDALSTIGVESGDKYADVLSKIDTALSDISFITLTDTPSSYTGEGGKILSVNSAEDAVEFVDITSFTIVVETTGTILFDKPREYYTATTPTTGNITNDLTDAKKGITQKIYHNDATAPTFPAGWVNLSGIYVPNVLNIIYCCWAGGTRVEYWIIQG